MKLLHVVFVVAIALASILSLAPDAAAQQVASYNVEIRSGVTSTVAVRVFDNPNVAAGRDVLIVPGLAQNARTFDLLASALFSEDLGDKVGRVFVLDLPGHGASTPPAPATSLLFGDLLLEDYTTVVLDITARVRPDVIVGHSMGAMIVQMAQARLASTGSSLRDSYGVRGAALLAPVIPVGLPWAFVPDAAEDILVQFITFVPELGLIVSFPPPAWIAIFYSDRTGTPVAGAPTQAEAATFSAPEPFNAGAQTIRLAPQTPVPAGIFGPTSGTVAGVVTLEQDAFFSFPSEHQTLYEHLTGDEKLKLFFTIEGATAVHNMHTFDPAELLHPIKKVINAMR